MPDDNSGSVISHGSFCFVHINQLKQKHWDLVDTIIHESVHVFQETMSYAEEKQTGIETQSYYIAAIAVNMLKDFYAMDEKRKAGL